MKCRHCEAKLEHTFLDLGFAPPSNAYLSKDELRNPEKYYPLKIKICNQCWLVQTEDYTQADELFNSEYAYFSSTSSSWLKHAELYADKVIKELQLGSEKFVVEIASNDGYLLKNFVAAGIACLGIEPTASTATAAEKLGIPVLREFFGEELGKTLASEGRQADLIIGNNVYAHVPNVNDFTRGLKAALKPGGTITLEFPHLKRLIENVLFDTIYHEHFSYFSLYTIIKIFNSAGLRIWNVEEIQTHGGSLRVYGCHSDDTREIQTSVNSILKDEEYWRLQSIETYLTFQAKADKIKNDLLTFLIEQKKKNKIVIAYGAAAKGNTLLNYAGVKPDLLPLVCDAAIAKQNKYMPGSHIPIHPPEKLKELNPDFILILPWNISDEVKSQLNSEVGTQTKFVVAVPYLNEL